MRRATLLLSVVSSVPLALSPVALAGFTPNHLFVAFHGSDRVVEFDLAGNVIREIGASGGLTQPWGLLFTPDGYLLVSSRDQDKVFVFESGGALITTFGAGALTAPAGMAIRSDGKLLVASSGADAIVAIDPDGTPHAAPIAPLLAAPNGIAALPDGNALIASSGTGAVLEVHPNAGTLIESFATIQVHPEFVISGPNGLLYVTSSTSNSVVIGNSQSFGATFADATADLSAPQGLAFGPDGHLYVASSGNDRVIVLDALGTKLAAIGVGAGYAEPVGIAFAPTRFEVKLSGQIEFEGDVQGTFSDRATLAYAPGSRVVLFQFADQPLKSNDYVSSFAQLRLAIAGNEIDDGGVPGKERMFHGAAVQPFEITNGFASLAFKASGKTGADGAFVPKEVHGRFQRSTSGIVLKARMTTVKLVE